MVNSGTGAASGGVVATQGSDAGVVTARDGGAPVLSVQGPQVTITEFVVTTNGSPAPGGICAGADGRIWFLHKDTGPSALGAITTDGANVSLY